MLTNCVAEFSREAARAVHGFVHGSVQRTIGLFLAGVIAEHVVGERVGAVGGVTTQGANNVFPEKADIYTHTVQHCK